MVAIIAIGVAVWVPSKIHSNETRRRNREVRLKGKAIALLIDQLLRDIDGQLERASVARRERPPQIEMPKTILSLSHDLWLMGEAGEYVLQLIGMIQTHNRMVMEPISLPTDMADEERREYWRGYFERIPLARGCITEALAAIDVVLKRRA